jgi:hypothetical protein
VAGGEDKGGVGMIIEPREQTWKTRLATDALYYAIAVRALDEAQAAEAELLPRIKRFNSLIQKEERAERIKNEGKRVNALEELAIQIEDGARGEVEASFRPLIENIVVTHIMCVACLEAYINIVAKDSFGGKCLDYFERLPLEAKWLYMPSLMNKAVLDPGREPFQSFSMLIKIRDKLIHYKPTFEDYEGKLFPGYVDELHLSVSAGELSVNLVPKLVEAICTQIGRRPPSWIGRKFYSCYYHLMDGMGEDELAEGIIESETMDM